MSKKINLVLLIVFLLSIFRVAICLLNEKETYHEEKKEVKGIITYIKKDKDKVVFDIKEKNKYRVTTYKNFNYELGDKVLVKGVFITPSNNTVFNLFNYRKYLLSKGIKQICNSPKITFVSKNKNLLYTLKNVMLKRIENYKTKNYLKAFIMADTTSIKKDIKNSYTNLGISHLLAISGMHVGVFLIFLNFLLKKFKYKDGIIFIFFLLFLFITGFTESLMRCVLFIFLNFLNKKFKLKISGIYIIILTACTLLFINPYLIYSVGFLFSVIITFFILLSKKYLDNKNYIKRTLTMSTICFLASIPILACYFFKINLLTPIFNLLFVPFVSFIILPFALLTFIFPFLDNVFLFLLYIFEYLVVLIDKIKILSFVIAKPNFLVIVLYYLFLYLSLKVNKKYILLFLIILIVNINAKFLISNLEITFLDVGQGDSFIMILPGGKSILIDTGGLYKGNYSLAENKLIPYLNSKGINKVNLLILTHGDQDHGGEAVNLVNNFKVEKVIFNCGEFNDLEQELIKVLNKKKIPYYSCIKELNINDNKLYFLNNNDYRNENDNSSVIYTELNKHKFLFMGDASIEIEEDLMEKYNLQDIDVLKVGHHGSKTSSSEEFIDNITPKYSIISVGKNNRYGHPNKEVLENLNNSKIYRTDEDGSIMFKIKNDKLQVEICTP